MKTVKDYKDWIDTYENPTENEKELIDGFKDILDEIFANHKSEIKQLHSNIEFHKKEYAEMVNEKDKQYGILLADKDKLEMYRHNRLKKSDVEVKVWCHSCERWVTDDIQDCYCQCTCNFGEDSDYDCIYEEDINVKSECPRNKEWSWQYKISEIQYKALEE